MENHFKLSEFACKCSRCAGKLNCGPTSISPKLLEVLNKIREKINLPIIVNSGYRCPEHNKEIGGEANSQHMKGTAADIRWAGMNTTQAAKIAEECGADGIGTYDSFVHVDVRGYRARWNG
jgi:uncharacterized protein YcbK (DUF882 family)